MKTRLLAIAATLALTLSTGAMACPKDQFQRQSGNFRWMISGQFNGQQFTQRGQNLRQLRIFLRRILRSPRNGPRVRDRIQLPTS